MAGGADLKKDAVLALERHFAVVEAAGGVHQAEGPDELLRVQPFELAGHGDRCSR